MAREYAQIRLDIWTDDDFRKLSPAAQHLYFTLLTSPTLSYCGVADWRPGRIAASARGWTTAQVRIAAAELIDGLFIVVDEDTEEVLVRSFIKHDGLLRNPKTSVSMANAFASVASATVRGVVIHQLIRLHETQPELKAWETAKVVALLDRESIDPADLRDGFTEDYPEGLPEDLPQGLGVGYPQGFTLGLPETDPEGLGVNSLPAPSPAPTTSSLEGYVSREPHQGDHDPHTPPTPRCPKHIDVDNPPACGACADARRARESWESEQARLRLDAQRAEREAAAAARAAAIDACDLCDERGYQGNRVCDHDPDTAARAARGMALVRQQLASKGTPS
ncbi:replication initiation protein [Gordonia phage William]|uniref:Helix-turn-helix DNA binding domain protein n=1 Tax=Gordonia phage William TaxID=2571253 RepID=A0A4Y6EEM9_9CAUD|nr:replication initiation protein [Gordonia phage William]QDF17168.1 hypothetical protein SEA_WILLIAM_73 [Gordonia phage William]